MNNILKIMPCYGIRPDCLGNYFTGLGLIAALSQKWPSTRGCWRNGCFVLMYDQTDFSSMQNFLLTEWEPSHYERWWRNAQKQDTKNKRDDSLWYERSRAGIKEVRLLDAHIVGSRRNQFNPVLGTGGNIGKRDLEKAISDALSRLENSKENKEAWLNETLHGVGSCVLPELNSAGTWFVYANKTFNSGQDWYREGEISPWSFILALEGTLLLSGSTSRRLSTRSRPYAVFPFITESPAPASEGEIGLTKAEFWAPLWEQPATLAEIKALLERGLARIGQRAAKSPHEFAVAAMASGVDAGVSNFVRFSLRQTTSSQVYEAIPQEKISVNRVESHESKLVEPLLSWIDKLPFEPSGSKQRSKFKGLRGPVEQSLIKIAAQPNNAEQWRKFLLCLADTQKKIDSNKYLRDRCRALPFLDSEWFNKCWPTPPPEIHLARAIASIGAGTDTPILVNINGIEIDKTGNIRFCGEGKPHRAVWHNGNLIHVLADVIERRLVDTDAKSSLPLTAANTCSRELLSGFLSHSLDLDLIQRWIPALTLIKWGNNNDNGQSDESTDIKKSPDGAYMLQSLFRPVFHPRPLRVNEVNLFPEHLMPRPILTRRLLGLIRQGNMDEAIQLARSRYLAAGYDIITPPPGLVLDGEIMAAAMLIPLDSAEVATSFMRWIKPKKNP